MAGLKQTTLKFGQAQTLGKRSRETVAELPSNAPVKRSKPAPDLHPGENKDKSGADEDSADVKQAHEDILNSKIFKLDAEVVVENPTKAAHQAKQRDDWFRLCEETDGLSSMYPDERRRRIQNCHDRYEFMLKSITSKAKATKRADVFDQDTQDNVPFTFSWWVFFVILSVDKVLGVLMESLPDAVKVILGGPLTTKELLMLPKKWEGMNMWAVYADILVGQEETGRYCGSSTNALDGLTGRLRDYDRIVNETKKPDSTKHSKWLVRAQKDEVKMNLRVIAVFDQCKIDKPYVMLMELLTTMVLRALIDDSCSSPYRPEAVLGMIRDATPRDLPDIRHTCLNSAAQCRQGLGCKSTAMAKVCANCKTTEMSIGSHWFSATAGMPFTGRVCEPCHHWRRVHNGDARPLEFETRRLHVVKLKADIGPRPAKGTPCPGCGCTPKIRTWLLPKGDHASEVGRERWECCNCAPKATNTLGAKKASGTPAAGSVRSAQLKQVGPKPATGTPCPGCDRPPPKERWFFPQGDLVLEPTRFRWECNTCHIKQTAKLADRRRQRPRK